jgi:hypothetical protein
MPDVIYADEDDEHKFWDHNPVGGIKYVRADLVPAANTGDKAGASDRLKECLEAQELYDRGVCTVNQYRNYRIRYDAACSLLVRIILKQSAPPYRRTQHETIWSRFWR